MRLGSSVQIALVLVTAFAVAAFTVYVIVTDDIDSEVGEVGQARYMDSFGWTMDKPWFGGWSGIELSSDGSFMTAITDRGRLIKADIIRAQGQIVSVDPRRRWRLKSSMGQFLTGRISDSEGLAVAPDGTIYISFEGITRVARYPQPTASAQVLRRHADFRRFSHNKSLESLAIDRRGRLFAIPERLVNGTVIRVYVRENDIWSIAFELPGSKGFLPVGADFGPDGQLYLLERAWGLRGFRSRVRRWEVSEYGPGNEQLLVQTKTGTHDNLEGLAVWRDQQGRTRLTMIADDNFMFFQQTEIVEYALPE